MADEPDRPGFHLPRHTCLDPECPRSDDPDADCATKRRMAARQWAAFRYAVLKAAAEQRERRDDEEPPFEVRRRIEVARLVARLARLENLHPGRRRADRRTSREMRREAREALARGTFRRVLHPARHRSLRPRIRELADPLETGSGARELLRELIVGSVEMEVQTMVAEDVDGSTSLADDLDRLRRVVDELPSRVQEEVTDAVLADEDRRAPDRRAGRREPLAPDADDGTPPDEPVDPDARRDVEAAAARVDARRLLDRVVLTPGERAAIEALYLDGLSLGAAAQRLDSTKRSVSALKSKALNKLRDHI